MTPPDAQSSTLRIAYLSLQAVEEGQDSWAAVTEIVEAWRSTGWQVDTWFVAYPQGAAGGLGRIREMLRVQRALKRRLADYDAVYLRGHFLGRPTASTWSSSATGRGDQPSRRPQPWLGVESTTWDGCPTASCRE